MECGMAKKGVFSQRNPPRNAAPPGSGRIFLSDQNWRFQLSLAPEHPRQKTTNF